MSNAVSLVFDVESGGVDTDNDRIIQLFIATADSSGELIETWEWFVNPGEPISEESIAVHGFTNKFLEEKGRDPREAFEEAVNVFRKHRDLVWVAFNLAFDLSFLDAEFKRHGISQTFGEWSEKNVRMADALVIDRHKDRYRKGKRKLSFMADHYGVDFNEDDAHDASYDVLKTAQVTAKVIQKYGLPSNKEQSQWYENWRNGFETYLRKTDPDANVEGRWPLKLA